MPRRVLLVLLLVLTAWAPVGCAAGTARPGAAGLGDRYFPLLGNGGYDVLHYDLDLTIDPEDWSLDGVATLEAVALHALSRFQLELTGLTVREVEVDGAPAAFHHEDGELLVTPRRALAADATFTLRVAYGGVPRAVPSPAVPFLPGVGWMPTGDALYVMSEPNGASSFFPCNDHPTDKARYSFALTVPEPLLAVANGVPLGVEPAGDEWRTFRFAANDPMASYLVTLAVGAFDYEETSGPGGLTLRAWLHPAVSVEQRASLELLPEMLELFSRLFGPYPFETFGTIGSNLPLGVALETQTVPTYGLGALRPSTLAHELAHQWFGNSVSMRDFSEIWLSEGFASYASWLWIEHREGQEAFAALIRGRAARLRRQNLGPPLDPGVGEMFGAAVYQRGAFALHALREAAGDETFFEILRTYTSRFRHGTASVEDFEALVREFAGAEVGAVLDAWLRAPQMPLP